MLLGPGEPQVRVSFVSVRDRLRRGTYGQIPFTRPWSTFDEVQNLSSGNLDLAKLLQSVL